MVVHDFDIFCGRFLPTKVDGACFSTQVSESIRFTARLSRPMRGSARGAEFAASGPASRPEGRAYADIMKKGVVGRLVDAGI